MIFMILNNGFVQNVVFVLFRSWSVNGFGSVQVMNDDDVLCLFIVMLLFV